MVRDEKVLEAVASEHVEKVITHVLVDVLGNLLQRLESLELLQEREGILEEALEVVRNAVGVPTPG